MLGERDSRPATQASNSWLSWSTTVDGSGFTVSNPSFALPLSNVLIGGGIRTISEPIAASTPGGVEWTGILAVATPSGSPAFWG